MFDSLHANRFLEDKITTSILSEDEIADAASPELADIRRHKRAASAKGQTDLAEDHLLAQLQEHAAGGAYHPARRALRRARQGGAPRRPARPCPRHFRLRRDAFRRADGRRCRQTTSSRSWKPRKKRRSSASSAPSPPRRRALPRRSLWDYDILVHLDLIFARGELSYQMDAARPEIRTDGSVSLRRARHPLLDPAKAVPIDIEAGPAASTPWSSPAPTPAARPSRSKPLGLLCLMAQCGLHIPAGDGSARVACSPACLADIGDEQSIEQSLSTFSAHMTNIVNILRRGGRRVPRPLRRAGRGHRPGRGRGPRHRRHRARAAPRGAQVAATTHYAELKAFAMTTRGRGERELRVRRGDALPHLPAPHRHPRQVQRLRHLCAARPRPARHRDGEARRWTRRASASRTC